MKPRNREINIFNIAMLDVISGAMGAFLIIMVILLPYYNKEASDYQRELQQSRAAEETARKATQTAEAAQRAAEETAQQLAKPFLLVHIQWGSKHQDVDLHVVDPSGAEFYFEHKTHPGRSGKLSVDSRFGPGSEVWSITNAPPGKYRIYANLHDTHGVNDIPTVTGSVIHRDGSTALPATQLPTKQLKYLMATVTVSDYGRVSIQ